jgi:hypothetical protein
VSSAAKVSKGTARLGYSVSSDTLTHSHTHTQRKKGGGEKVGRGRMREIYKLLGRRKSWSCPWTISVTRLTDNRLSTSASLGYRCEVNMLLKTHIHLTLIVE